MALPVIADCYRVAFQWQMAFQAANGSDPVNVAHFSAPGKTAAQVYSIIDTAWAANLIKSTSAVGVISQLDITKLDGSSATQSFVTGSGAKWTGGTAGGDPIPAQCTIVKLATALRGPRYRGRLFLPYLSEAEQSVGNITPATVTTMSAAWVTFANAVATAGAALGVASYVGSVWTQVVNIAVEGTAATQRRRQRH